MKLRAQLLIASMLTLVLGATLVHGAALASPEDFSGVAEIVGDGTQTCVGDSDSIAAATKLRSRVGLESDRTFVKSTFESSAYICTAFGVPLTPAEASSFLAYINSQGELSDLAESVTGDPTFGGAFLDGTRLVIVSTDGRLGEALTATRGSIERRAAKFTLSELEAVAAQITEAAKTAKSDDIGSRITYVSVNPATNSVDVGIAEDVAMARTALVATHGDAVTVAHVALKAGEHFACTENDCGTKGGLKIVKGSTGCTSGFVVKARKNSGAWGHYMLTAGHCIHNSGGIGSTANWKNGAGTVTWGRSKGHSFWESECEGWTRCWDNDLGLYALGSSVPATKNEYFVGSAVVSINGSKTKANQLIGQTVWRHGVTSGFDQGEITAKPNFYAYSCFPYTCKHFNTVEVNEGSADGDSGAGYYRFYSSAGVTTRYAYGIAALGPTGGSVTHYYAWNEYFDDYSNNVCDVWQVQPCTTAACTLP